MDYVHNQRLSHKIRQHTLDDLVTATFEHPHTYTLTSKLHDNGRDYDWVWLGELMLLDENQVPNTLTDLTSAPTPRA